MARLPQLVLGVDTHKDLHVAVLLDRLGRYLATASFATSLACSDQSPFRRENA